MSQNNSRKYWRTIKSLVKESKDNEQIPPLLDGNTNNYAFTDKEKADALNEYFASISTINSNGTVLPEFYSKSTRNISDIEITEQEIIDIIRNLDVKKATGPDEISHFLLKNTSQSICKPLCKLFNKSLINGQFPENWKTANIIALFKKGDKSLASNYRPISLISCVGKVMERIVFKHIYNHLVENNLIFKNQSGFLPGHSTVYQLIDIYHQICYAADNKETTCIIFCDISKAFDRVWHDGLIFKLKQNGITGNLLIWLKSYLINRKQMVRVGNDVSSILGTNAGVPQGSVLGPLLFLIYVNDISDNIISLTRLFADDSSLAVTSNDINEIEYVLNKDMESISKWASQWLVNFNPNKTEAMIFSNRFHQLPVIRFNNVEISFVKNHKHLGITLSEDCKWHEHIFQITKYLIL